MLYSGWPYGPRLYDCGFRSSFEGVKNQGGG